MARVFPNVPGCCTSAHDVIPPRLQLHQARSQPGRADRKKSYRPGDPFWLLVSAPPTAMARSPPARPTRLPPPSVTAPPPDWEIERVVGGGFAVPRAGRRRRTWWISSREITRISSCPSALARRPPQPRPHASSPSTCVSSSSSPLVVTPEPFNESVGLHRRWALRAMHEALLVHAPQDSLRDGGGRGRMAGEAALRREDQAKDCSRRQGLVCLGGGSRGAGSRGAGGGGGIGIGESGGVSGDGCVDLSSCAVLSVTGEGAVAIVGINRGAHPVTVEFEAYVKVNLCRCGGLATNQQAKADAYYQRRRALEDELRKRAEEAQRRNGGGGLAPPSQQPSASVAAGDGQPSGSASKAPLWSLRRRCGWWRCSSRAECRRR